MIKKTALITLLALLTLATGWANEPKRSVVHNADFVLERAVTWSVKSGGASAVAAVDQLLQGGGATIQKSFFKKLFAPKIIIKQVRSVEGARGDNALRIDVSTSRVSVMFTTEESLSRAFELLASMIVEKRGVSVIQGTDIIDWSASAFVPKPGAGAVDLTSGALLARGQIEALIAKTKAGTQLELTVVSPRGWVIESRALDGVHPSAKIYSATGFYTTAQLKTLADYAATRGVKMVLRAELLENNKAFKRVTGFDVNSVEGMRFVRALLGEWRRTTGIDIVDLGNISKSADERFMEFLKLIDPMIDTQIIFD